MSSINPRRIVSEAIIHCLLLVVVALATLIGYNTTTPTTLRAGDELSQPFSRFYAIEHQGTYTYRWSDGEGMICLDQVGHLPAGILRMALFGGWAISLGVTTTDLYVNNTLVTTLPFKDELRVYHVLVSAPMQTGDTLCTTLRSPTITAPSASDTRTLGVPFKQLSLTPLLTAGMVQPAKNQLIANLLLTLICVWMVRSLGLRGWIAALGVGSFATLLGIAVGRGAVEAGLSLAREEFALAFGLGVVLLGWTVFRLGWPALIARWPRCNNPLARELLLMAFWSVALVSIVSFIQELQDRHGAWPLKAGVNPGFTPVVLIAVGLFAVWLAVMLWLLNSERMHPLVPLAVAMIGAIVLPVALKVTVRGWDSLFTTFRDNPADYIHDVPNVGNPIAFLGKYVAISPTLAWHNANHPPGSVLLLWVVSQLFGPGTVPASWAMIALGSIGALAAFLAGMRLGGLAVATLAAAIYVVMPGHEIYSVTSMDIVFMVTIGLGIVLFFLALDPQAPWWIAVLAGLVLGTGLFFTFAATQIAFFGVVTVLLSLLRPVSEQRSSAKSHAGTHENADHQPTGAAVPLSQAPEASFSHRIPWQVIRERLPNVLRQSSIAGGTLIALYLLISLTTGFHVVQASLQATANNARLLGLSADNNADLLAPPSIYNYVHFMNVNIVPFLWYLGPWGLAALTPMIVASYRKRWRPDGATVLVLGLVGLVLGMWLSGLFIREVERIWGFVYPAAAALIALYAWQGDRQYERMWRAGLYITLFFAQSAIMRMLLNTYW